MSRPREDCLLAMLLFLSGLFPIAHKSGNQRIDDAPAQQGEWPCQTVEQVKADGTLSVQLQWRLDAAYDAWEASPCLVVTCGAQGADEPAPEGQVMREYLIGRGIPEWQVLADTDSYNTRQNIENAAALLRECMEQVMTLSVPLAAWLSAFFPLNSGAPKCASPP